MSKEKIYMTIEYEDFLKLIRGKKIEKGSVSIILSDIGYEIMIEELEKAYKEFLLNY